MMKIIQLILLISLSSCITEFIPVTEEEKELLVVEGLITNQPGPYSIKISKSQPFGRKSEASPLTGCIVRISDNSGNLFLLSEKGAGKYETDSATFRGQEGRTYKLHIETYNGNRSIHYESVPMQMIPVPPIDSIYYIKTIIKQDFENFGGIDGCQIFLDTHDPENRCKYFRWDFDETWILRLLWPVKNIRCWVSDTSKLINIKSTAAFNESKVIGQPVTFISNITDRLQREYSLSVNQYSISEDEFIYWDKIDNMAEQSGGLYDIIPASIPSNLFCIENPGEKVLGYFSVSSRTSKRIFIKDDFSGIINQYPNCPTDTVYGEGDIWGLDMSVWVLSDNPPSFGSPRTRILTNKRGCADCTTRGTTKRPPFWKEE